MKKYFLLAAACASLAGLAQDRNEFAKQGNGLIYADSTVKQLKHIVDSLNLKFKVCDANPRFFAKAQSCANYIRMKGHDAKSARMDMTRNMPYGEFVKKYRLDTKEEELLVVKFNYKDYNGSNMVEFSSIELGDRNDHSISFTNEENMYTKPLKNKWVFDLDEDDLEAFYFTEEFNSAKLSDKYARMVQYSDCMVDTSTEVMLKRGGDDDYYGMSGSKKVSTFMEYAGKLSPAPKKGDSNYTFDILDSARCSDLDKKKDAKFDKLMKEAVADALKNGGSTENFEELVGRYYSKKAQLELMRRRRVVGFCSMDSRPRQHAFDIAVLAAQTVSWEVFLRAHLNIMNDRFERASDGSYAWANRKTYIKELEVLDINVFDLLLGISMRVENPATNHYYGSIGRLGRAMAETSRPEELESRMLEMVADGSLDNYNRVLIYYLFLNYNYNLESKVKRKVNIEKLNEAVKKMPDYLAKHMAVVYKEKE